MPSKRTIRYAVLLVVVVILTFMNALLIKSFDIAGLPILFGAALFLQLCLLILLVFSLVTVLHTPLRISWSIIVSALRGIEKNIYFARVLKRIPFVVPWIEQRFSLKRPTGLKLTIGSISIVVFVSLFVLVVQFVVTKSVYVGIDQRIINLMPTIRNGSENNFFSFFTFASSYIGILFFIGSVALLGWFKRQRWLPALFLIAYGFVALISEILKNSIGRARPDTSLRELVVSGYSFPSGHTLAATVIYGLVAYLLVRYSRSSIAKLLVRVLVVTLVIMVALSRVYFGVHYPTDVIGSILLGCAILTMIVTFLELQRFELFLKINVSVLRSTLIIGLVCLALFTVVAATYLTMWQNVTSQVITSPLPSINNTTVSLLPHISETLSGAKMEPINFVYIASDAQLEKAFKKAGWSIADAPTVSNSLKELLAAGKNQQYLTAPVSPSYLDSKPQTIAFEKPTATNTARQRHHTRIWKTQYTIDGQSVWVGTASLDVGIEIGKRVPIPTHHIDPNVDAERSYIIQSLGVMNPQYVTIVSPELGRNASGDSFFTDGRAVIINLAQ